MLDHCATRRACLHLQDVVVSLCCRLFRIQDQDGLEHSTVASQGLLCVVSMFAHVSACETYTNAHDISQCHCVTEYSEIVVTEDLLQPLEDRWCVLRQRRVLRPTHKQTHKTTVKQTCSAGWRPAWGPAGAVLPLWCNPYPARQKPPWTAADPRSPRLRTAAPPDREHSIKMKSVTELCVCTYTTQKTLLMFSG